MLLCQLIFYDEYWNQGFDYFYQWDAFLTSIRSSYINHKGWLLHHLNIYLGVEINSYCAFVWTVQAHLEYEALLDHETIELLRTINDVLACLFISNMNQTK